MTKVQKITYYSLLVLISLAFIMAAYPKLIADPQSVNGFSHAHLPIWFMYFIGVAELAGAIGLWIRQVARYAAAGLFVILTGAVVVTLIYSPFAYVIMPIIFIIVLGYIVKLGKKLPSTTTR